MSHCTIITDHKWKPFKYRNEVPGKVLADQFDYQDEDVTDGYMNYRGRWYHLDEFIKVDKHNPFYPMGWNGYAGDSYFSGILIKVSEDGERYQIALYLS